MPDYTVNSTATSNLIYIPSSLTGFIQTEEPIEEISKHGRKITVIHGELDEPEAPSCPCCGRKMHVNQQQYMRLMHVTLGSGNLLIKLKRNQYRCKPCETIFVNEIAFRHPNHRITKELHAQICMMLGTMKMSITDIAKQTGVDRSVIRDIDEVRLQALLTCIDPKSGKRVLKKPERQAQYLAIDEFKLHDNHKFATHIIDLDTGHVLYVSHGKKKQVVYEFIEHVGEEFMKGVKAVACDMNSDFQEAFETKCPWINIVFDHFHLVKNFNEKVIGAIRKDEFKRLIANNEVDKAHTLKGSRFILTSSREHLEELDKTEGQVLRQGGGLFNAPEIVRKGGRIEKLEAILKENKLLATCEIIKEELKRAYKDATDSILMELNMRCIAELCETTNNEHLCWFAKLIRAHMTGICNYAEHQISSGKIEGINNKIKTMRRMGYGYPKDEYFFLKIMGMSRGEKI